MPIDQLLAVVPVADFDAAHEWYERLFGRPADNLPMEGRLVEWRVTGNGWVQVTADAGRAGSALLNFAVDDLARHIASLAGRGLVSGAIETVNKASSCPRSPTPTATRSPSSATSGSNTEPPAPPVEPPDRHADPCPRLGTVVIGPYD